MRALVGLCALAMLAGCAAKEDSGAAQYPVMVKTAPAADEAPAKLSDRFTELEPSSDENLKQVPAKKPATGYFADEANQRAGAGKKGNAEVDDLLGSLDGAGSGGGGPGLAKDATKLEAPGYNLPRTIEPAPARTAAMEPPPPPPPEPMAAPRPMPKPSPVVTSKSEKKRKKRKPMRRSVAAEGLVDPRDVGIDKALAGGALADGPLQNVFGEEKEKAEFDDDRVADKRGPATEVLEPEPEEAEEEEAFDYAFDPMGGRDDDGRFRARLGAKRGGKSAFGRNRRQEAALRWQNEITGELKADEFAQVLEGRIAGGEEGEFGFDLDGQGLGDFETRLPEDPDRFVEPAKTLPRMCYFENTYLGGNAAYAERLRRLDVALAGENRPHRRAALPRQAFDAPTDAGLALTATLDRAWVDQPQRVYLQIGLQGSKRFGWRRPPLDIALVVDRPLLDDGGELLIRAITALSRRLGPQDRLGVILSGAMPHVIGELAPLRDRLKLARAIEGLEPGASGGPATLGDAMVRAGEMLVSAAGDTARIPGTQTVLVLTDGRDDKVPAASAAAHALTVQGAVTSVVQVGGGGSGQWWTVANAGHGNQHRARGETLERAIEDELSSISRVIARLLRVNIRLGPDVEAIRVVGAKMLGQEEVKRVKAREEATDQNLSKTMGVKADRGDDDDGIQTVIPYFYGGDSHVILVELWVKGPGAVAEVELKYKDMVALSNATARSAADLERFPRPSTPAQRQVAANVRGFELAEGLGSLADVALRADQQTVLSALGELRPLARGRDAALLDGLTGLVQRRGADATVADALRMARDRRLGQPRN